jgi:hypothetical protein
MLMLSGSVLQDEKQTVLKNQVKYLYMISDFHSSEYSDGLLGCHWVLHWLHKALICVLSLFTMFRETKSKDWMKFDGALNLITSDIFSFPSPCLHLHIPGSTVAAHPNHWYHNGSNPWN